MAEYLLVNQSTFFVHGSVPLIIRHKATSRTFLNQTLPALGQVLTSKVLVQGSIASQLQSLTQQASLTQPGPNAKQYLQPLNQVLDGQVLVQANVSQTLPKPTQQLIKGRLVQSNLNLQQTLGSEFSYGRTIISELEFVDGFTIPIVFDVTHSLNLDDGLDRLQETINHQLSLDHSTTINRQAPLVSRMDLQSTFQVESDSSLGLSEIIGFQSILIGYIEE